MALGETLKKIPTWAWVAIGVILLIGLYLIVKGKGKGTAQTPVIPSAAVTDTGGGGSGDSGAPIGPQTTPAQWQSAQADFMTWLSGQHNVTAGQAYGQWQSIIRRDVPALTGASDAVLMTLFNTFNTASSNHSPLTALDSIVAYVDTVIGTTPVTPSSLTFYNGSGLVSSPVNG